MADRHTTEKLLEGERLSGKVTLFAKVTILPGDELPYHEHHGETETYHILSGEGMYQDNDKTYPVQAGSARTAAAMRFPALGKSRWSFWR